MKVKEIEVRMGVTKNLGNYESARLDYGMTIAVGEGESVVEVRQRTFENLQKHLLRDLNQVVPGK